MIETLSRRPEAKEVKDQRPYVVSADIRILLQRWANQNRFKIPDEKFFRKLRTDFGIFMKQIFPGFEMVTEEEISTGLNVLVRKNGLYPLSLDRVYYRSHLRLDIARQISDDGEDIGLGRRANSPFLLNQFRGLKKLGINELSVVDDVIFTGDLIARIGETLDRMGIKVKGVCAGIGIMEGIVLLRDLGYEVRCVRTYENVIDALIQISA